MSYDSWKASNPADAQYCKHRIMFDRYCQDCDPLLPPLEPDDCHHLWHEDELDCRSCHRCGMQWEDYP